MQVSTSDAEYRQVSVTSRADGLSNGASSKRGDLGKFFAAEKSEKYFARKAREQKYKYKTRSLATAICERDCLMCSSCLVKASLNSYQFLLYMDHLDPSYLVL